MRKVLWAAVGALILLGMAGAGLAALQGAIAEGESPILAIILLGVPILVAGALVAAVLQFLVRPLRRHNTLVGVMALAVSGALAVGVIATNSDIVVRRPDAAVTAAVAPACAGQAVAAAGGLETSSARINHLVALDQSGAEFGWTGKPSVEWRPPTVDDTELVACIDAEDTFTQIEYCEYNGPPTRRYSARREIRVMVAQTGAQLARFAIIDEPGDCPYTKVGNDKDEMRGSVTWESVEAHLVSLVAKGVFIDPDVEQPAVPGASLEPRQTAAPIATPEPTAPIREVSLAAAISEGLVTAKGTGDSLQTLDLQITSKAAETLEISVPAGTYFVPKRAATQTMVVIAVGWVEVPAGETVKVTLQVACAQMHDDQPGAAGKAEAFTVRAAPAKGDLAKLLQADAFAEADFRLQQFAVWTITSNPTKSGYVHLGTFGVGSGPSAAELREIKAMFKSAGIATGAYRALP